MKRTTHLQLLIKSLLLFACIVVSQITSGQTLIPEYEMNISAYRMSVDKIKKGTRIVTLKFFLPSPAEKITIYIDGNDDGSYADGEIVYSKDTVLSRDKYSEITFTIDDNVPSGKHNWAIKVIGATEGTEHGGTSNGGKSYGFNIRQLL